MAPSFYILDGHGYTYQAFYALGKLNAPDGTPTNAVFGVAKLIEKILKAKPDYLAVCFDPPGPSFRKAVYDEYKANRKPMPDEMRPQIPIIKEMLAAYRISVVEVEHYEADDVMATLARKASQEGLDVYIVTNDKDIHQLVSDNIKIYDHKNDAVIGVQEVQDRFHLAVSQLPDYFGLVGDAVDNIPGVRGIGPKTAQSLVQKWHDLESIYAHLDEVGPARVRKLLAECKDLAFLSKKLFLLEDRVGLDFKLEDFRVGPPRTEALMPLFQRLGFRSLLAGLPAAAPVLKEYRVVSGDEELLSLRDLLSKQDLIVLEVDGVEKKIWDSSLQGLCFAWQEDEAAYVPWRPDVIPLLLPLVQENGPKAGHDLKKTYRILYNHGVVPSPLIFDTMLAAYLLSPSLKELSLENLCREYLGESSVVFPNADAKGEEKARYFCSRACQIYRLARKLGPLLAQADLEELFREIELPLIPVLVEMELSGISVDPEILARISDQLKQSIQELESKICEAAGESFNIASTQQLGHILFEKLGLPKGKKTKSGYSTNSEVLEDLAIAHPIAAQVLEYRQLTKLANTYVDVLPSYLDRESHRIHTLFHQTGTITGRLSSSDPNLQNIPVRTEIGSKTRQAFIAPPGTLLITADYSQIELRVLAHFSKDPRLMDAFHNDLDIHAAVARDIFKTAEVTPEQRRIAKSVNFGIIYGQSPYGLSRELRISVKEAKKFIDAYFVQYARVREFLDEAIEEAREKKYVVTLLKRRRYIPDIDSKKHNARKLAERTAINTIMQGSAADIIKNAMIHIYQRRNEKMLPFKILLQIHDELILESPAFMIAEVVELVQAEMLGGIQLSVPLKVNLAAGKNWLDAKPLTSPPSK